MTVTYEVVGNAEDVDSLIHSISTVDTPLHNIAKKGKADNVLVQWQQRELAAPAENKVVEGADAGAGSYTASEMLNNYTQLLEKPFNISTSQEATKSHGRKSEIADQSMVKRMELKRDVEFAFVGDWDATPNAGAAGTARRMKTAVGQLDASVKVDGSGAALTTANMESRILTGLQTCYEAGSVIDTIFVTPKQSVIWADIARETGRNRDVQAGKVVNKVDTYDTPFGPVSFVLARIQDGETILGVNREMWEVATLQATKLEPLAKTGHAQKMNYSTELTLKCLNDKASFAVTGITYS